MDPEVIFYKFIKLMPSMEKEVAVYESSGENSLKVRLKDGTVMIFTITDDGFTFTKN